MPHTHSFCGPARLALATLQIVACTAWAQTPPDAGSLLQQERTAPLAPAAPPALSVSPADAAAVAPGGTTVKLQSVRFSGHTAFSEEQLLAALGQVTGQTYDMAGLQGLATRISKHYRNQQFPFARAYVPAQKFTDGTLHIAILEGRYGRVHATGDAALETPAGRFLASLQPGTLISAPALERATLILDDQPGVEIKPIVRPGQEVGTGDLVVQVRPTPRWRGDIGIDNHGSRYTGVHRAVLNLTADSPFTFGDQFTLKALYSDAKQWLGNIGYSLPLGSSGLRAQISHAHTYYELGKQFHNLQATGTADISSVGLSYPLIRSRRSNLTLVGMYQYKRLKDEQGATQSSNHKVSKVLPLNLQFDHRDTLGGQGITFGSVGVTTGELRLGAAQLATDASTAKTHGSFYKLNLDVARYQATPISGLMLYGRASAQWAQKNLDSSEDFGLGGTSGVRAYPSGEGFGDSGWLAQIEARYAIGPVNPYVFHDHGHIKAARKPWSTGDNQRNLSGSGVGVRFQKDAFSLDASAAWRHTGGPATSDGADRRPRVWLQGSWRF